MKQKMICFVPIISDDWESDPDSCPEDNSCEEQRSQEGQNKHMSLSMKVQYDPTPESLKERKLFLKDEATQQKKLCRSCIKEKLKDGTLSEDEYQDIQSDKKVQFQDKKKDSKSQSKKITSKDEESSLKSELTEIIKRNIEDASKEEPVKLLLKSMKPVPGFVRKQIYKGISHHGNGRVKYLNMRYAVPPEDRWTHPITSSMEYGWTWGYPIKAKVPEFGKKMIIFQSFYRVKDTQLKPTD
ncbi:uncharacterized protein TNIN_255541 [Trichonephila inaurata madagascariensis]|uniref:Sperm microtubule inner protein 1 C-terminal domain-containing protein n=1 Tax=Trichonephila inaurata madagascariensis TaxID=2747483 RepID=A0A8X6X7C2_9ARAC|nr:uncharacterized protein TNIN_255541 [Trichonephila inaurata madagascariensis]